MAFSKRQTCVSSALISVSFAFDTLAFRSHLHRLYSASDLLGNVLTVEGGQDLLGLSLLQSNRSSSHVAGVFWWKWFWGHWKNKA